MRARQSPNLRGAQPWRSLGVRLNRYNAEPTQFTRTRRHLRRMSFFADKAAVPHIRSREKRPRRMDREMKPPQIPINAGEAGGKI